MAWHDVMMILRWRRKHPPVDTLLRAIAESLGVRFSTPESASRPQREIDPKTLHDPTADIRAAFAGAKFAPEVGNLAIPERLKYA
jgi:hypothetical protein